MGSPEYDQNENGLPVEHGGASVPSSQISSIENSENSSMRPDNANSGSRETSARKETSAIGVGSNVSSSHSPRAGAMSERSTKSLPAAVDSSRSCPELNESPTSSGQELEYLSSEASEDTANLSMLVHFPSSSPEETGPDSLGFLDWQRVPSQKCSNESRENTRSSELQNIFPPRRNLDSSARLNARVDPSAKPFDGPSTQDTLKQSHLPAETRSQPKHLPTLKAEALSKGGEIVETPFHFEGNFIKRKTNVSSETAMTPLNGGRPGCVSKVLRSEAAEERPRTQLPTSEQGSHSARNLRPTHLSSYSSSSCILENKSASVPPIKRSSQSESRMRNLADQRPNHSNTPRLFNVPSCNQHPNSSKIVATRFLSPTFYPQSYHSVSSGPNTPTRKDIFALVSDNAGKLHFQANEGASVHPKRFRYAASSARGTSHSSAPISVSSDNYASTNESVPVTQNMEVTASRCNVGSHQKRGESETVKHPQNWEEKEFLNNVSRGPKIACNKPKKSRTTKRPTFFRKEIEQFRNLFKKTPKSDAPLNLKRNYFSAVKSFDVPVPSLEHVDIVAAGVQSVSPCSAARNLEATDSSGSNELNNLQLNGCTSPETSNQKEIRHTYKAEVPRYAKLRCNEKHDANDHKIINKMPDFRDSLENVNLLNRDQTNAIPSVDGVEDGCIPESLDLGTQSQIRNLSNAVPSINSVKKLWSRVINRKPRKNSSEQTGNVEPNYNCEPDKLNYKARNDKDGREKTTPAQRCYVKHQTPLKDAENEERKNLYNDGNSTSEYQYQNLPSGAHVPYEASSNILDRNEQSVNTRKARVSSTDVTGGRSSRSSHSRSQKVVYENAEFLNFVNIPADVNTKPPKEKYSRFSPELRAERNSFQPRNKSVTPVDNPHIPRDPPPSRMAVPSTSSTSTRALGANSNSVWVPENLNNMHRSAKKLLAEPATTGALTSVSSTRQRDQITKAQRNVPNSTLNLPVSGYVNSTRIEQRQHSGSDSRFQFGDVAPEVQGKRKRKHWIKPETTVNISESDSGYVVMTNYHTKAAKYIPSVPKVESSSDAPAPGSKLNTSIGLSNTDSKNESLKTPQAQRQENHNLNPPNSLAAAEALQMELPNTTPAPTMPQALMKNMQTLGQMYEAQIQRMTQAYLMAQMQVLALIWRTAQNPVIEYNTRISAAVTTADSVPVLPFDPMTPSRVQRAISFPRARQSLSLEVEERVRINGQSLNYSDNIHDLNYQLAQNTGVRYLPEPQTNRSGNESSNAGLTTESSPKHQRASPSAIMPPVNSASARTTNTKTVAGGSSSKMSQWSPENLNPGRCQDVARGNQGYSSLGGPRADVETTNVTGSSNLGTKPDKSNRFPVPPVAGDLSRNELQISPLNSDPNFSGNLHVVTQENTTNSTTNDVVDTFFKNLMASTVSPSFPPDMQTAAEGNLFRADVTDVSSHSPASAGGAGETGAGGAGATEANKMDKL